MITFAAGFVTGCVVGALGLVFVMNAIRWYRWAHLAT